MPHKISRVVTLPRCQWVSFLLAPLFLASACSATYPVNQPLGSTPVGGGYTLENTKSISRNSNDTMVLLAFSGGGTRAAAFSYGVLQELSETYIDSGDRKRSLIDEVDVITAVSGGSFTAAYFGLYGDRIFDDYERVFLRRNVQGELTSGVINPLNWPKLASPFYTRADLATELYDETIFGSATFADLKERDGPFIIINATEMTLGTRFQFTQNYGDVICSDLSRLPVARAVASSSAVPILFSPITMKSYAGDCAWDIPEWARLALASEDRSSRQYNLASNIIALDDIEDHPYLHLFDGGLADNLGLRAMMDGVLRHSSIEQALSAIGRAGTRTVVIVLVNAETALDVESSRQMQSPTFSAALGAATSVPLVRYSFETVALLKDQLKDWERDSYQTSCGERLDDVGKGPDDSGQGCTGVNFHFVEVNFSGLQDEAERDYLKKLPTSFVLTDEAVDRLIAAGRKLIRDDPEYQRLLKNRQLKTDKYEAK